MNSDSHDHTQVAENFYHEKVFKCKECDEIRSSKKAMKKHLKRSGHSGFTVDSGFPVVEEKQHVLPEQPPLDHNLPVVEEQDQPAQKKKKKKKKEVSSQEIPQPEVQVLPAGQKVGCPKCTGYFENKWTCQRHLKEQHGVTSETELKTVPKTKKICPDCGK